MIEEHIKNTMRVLDRGLSIASIWQLMGAAVRIAVQYLFKPRLRKVPLFYACSQSGILIALLVISLIPMLVSLLRIEHTPYYGGITLFTLLAATFIWIWTAFWVVYLVNLRDIELSGRYQRMEIFISSVTLMIVLITLSIASYLWFQR